MVLNEDGLFEFNTKELLPLHENHSAVPGIQSNNHNEDPIADGEASYINDSLARVEPDESVSSEDAHRLSYVRMSDVIESNETSSMASCIPITCCTIISLPNHASSVLIVLLSDDYLSPP
ncbi:unnamed protein product [Urochloa humidicola]